MPHSVPVAGEVRQEDGWEMVFPATDSRLPKNILLAADKDLVDRIRSTKSPIIRPYGPTAPTRHTLH